MVVEVVWEDSPASVLKVVSVALVFVVVTPASVVTEVSVLKDTERERTRFPTGSSACTKAG